MYQPLETAILLYPNVCLVFLLVSPCFPLFSTCFPLFSRVSSCLPQLLFGSLGLNFFFQSCFPERITKNHAYTVILTVEAGKFIGDSIA